MPGNERFAEDSEIVRIVGLPTQNNFWKVHSLDSDCDFPKINEIISLGFMRIECQIIFISLINLLSWCLSFCVFRVRLHKLDLKTIKHKWISFQLEPEHNKIEISSERSGRWEFVGGEKTEQIQKIGNYYLKITI